MKNGKLPMGGGEFPIHDLRRKPPNALLALARMRLTMADSVACCGQIVDSIATADLRLALIQGGISPEQVTLVREGWKRVEELLAAAFAETEKTMDLMHQKGASASEQPLSTENPE